MEIRSEPEKTHPSKCGDFISHLPKDFALSECIGHQDEIRTIIIDKDSNSLFSGGWDSQIHHYSLINSSKIAPINKYSNHTGSITSLSFNPFLKLLFSTTKSGEVGIFDVSNNLQLSMVCLSPFPIFSIDQFVENSLGPIQNIFFVVGTAEKKVKIFQVNFNINTRQLENTPELLNIYEFPASVHVVKFSPDHSYISCTGDSTRLKNIPFSMIFPEKTKEDISVEISEKYLYSFDFHPYEPWIILGGKEKKIFLYNYHENQKLWDLKIPKPTQSLSFSPCGRFFLHLSFDNQITIYDIRSQKICQEMSFNLGEKLTIGLASDWSLIAISPFKIIPPRIKVWALKKKK